jgi:hypothetical protein
MALIMYNSVMHNFYINRDKDIRRKKLVIAMVTMVIEAHKTWDVKSFVRSI